MRRAFTSLILLASLTGAASAQEFYVGQILSLGTNFCPRGTLTADGSILPISQYTALYSLLGTTYGGNGTTNFGLPKLMVHTPANQPIQSCVVNQGIYPPRP